MRKTILESNVIYIVAENLRKGRQRKVSRRKLKGNPRKKITKDIQNSMAKTAPISSEYFTKSIKQILFGNYSEDVTLLGTGGQIGLGIAGLDLPMDIRDLSYDLTHFELTKEHISQTAIDLIGLIPVIGVIKYSDEAAELLKAVKKMENNKLLLRIDGYKETVLKHLDELKVQAKKYLEQMGEKVDEAVTDSSKGSYKSTLSELDAQGYDDFLHRTEGMFTSEQDAQKAFQQLLDRDFKGFAKNFDFSTKPDTAYFWSGDKAFADQIAKSNGGTIMESTPGGQVVDNWDWLEKKYPSSNWGTGNDLDPQPLWKAISKEYANGVSGKVTYVNQLYEGKVWLNDESPIVDKLMDKGIVSSVDYYNKEYLINKILSEGEKGW